MELKIEILPCNSGIRNAGGSRKYEKAENCDLNG